jgi:hypothetical protein
MDMSHPLVEQLRFVRSEFRRALADVDDADARRRFLPMNCISWNIGHLAWQEQRYWLTGGESRILLPALNVEFAYGAPASTPPLAAMWDAWQTITGATDPWLDTVTTATLTTPVTLPGWGVATTFGSLMLRVIDHYWYHIGESMAIRQLLGHAGLPDFVGDIDGEAPYRPEQG